MENGFGGRLRLLRKKSGMTQAQLAQMLNKSTSTVRMWEIGTNEPDMKTLVKLSTFFDSSLDYLLCRDIVQGTEAAVKTNVAVVNVSEFNGNFGENAIAYRKIPSQYTDDGNAYIVLKNDVTDMCPEIPVGAYVLVRRQDSCLNGQTVFVRKGTEFMIRKVHYFSGGMLLRSNAADVDPVFIDADDDFEVVGIVVEYTYTF